MPTRRILVRAPNWLGDMVMALPAIRLVRRADPAAHLAVAAPEGAVKLFSFAPDVDEVVPLSGARGLSGLRRLSGDVASLEAARPDVALLLTNSFSSAWAATRAGIRERWGYRRDARGRLLTRGVRRRDAEPRSTHHSDYYVALVGALGLTTDTGVDEAEPEPSAPAFESRSAQPYLQATDEVRAGADEALAAAGWDGAKPLVGVAPGAAYGRAKQYPPDLMAPLVGGLVAAGWTPLLLGAREDEPAGRAIMSALRASEMDARILDMIGRTSLAMLVGLVDRCSALVSNDSGAMHIAAALGIPVVAIFGSTDERATAPLGPHVILSADVWCRPCLLRECPIDHRCMRRIPPGRAVEAVQRLARM